MQPRLFGLPFVHRKGDTVCQVCLKTELRSRWIPPIEGLRFRIRFYPSMGGIKPNPSHWYVGAGIWLASQSRISLWYVAAFHSLIISKVNKGIRFFNFIISSWTSNGCRIGRMKRQRISIPGRPSCRFPLDATRKTKENTFENLEFQCVGGH